MNLERLRTPSRPWVAALAALALLLGAAGWLQWSHARSTDALLEAVRLQQDRIVLAQQWKAQVENVGERVIASNAATDPSLTALIDGRVRVGLGRAAALQARIARNATGAQDLALLERIAAERLAVADLDRRMRELRTAGDGVALRSFVADRYLPALASHAVALDDFVQLQVHQRDDLIAETGRARRAMRMQYAGVAALLLCLSLLLARAAIVPARGAGPEDRAGGPAADDGAGDADARPRAAGIAAPAWCSGLPAGR